MSDLDGLLDIDVADVHKGTRVAGVLRREHNRVVFEYVEGYDGPDVATTLPRDDSQAAAPPGAVPPFFAGLLPEGRRLAVLQQALKTSADDELPQLLAVGADTIGDVRVVPAGQSPRSPAPRVDLAAGNEHARPTCPSGWPMWRSLASDLRRSAGTSRPAASGCSADGPVGL